MITAPLPLNGDVETHGTVIGAPTAWQAIDEDPHDGDTTRIRINNLSAVEASSVDGSLLPNTAAVQTIRVRWTASGVTDSLDPTTAFAGVRVGGVDHYGPARLLPLGTYQTFEEEFPGPWDTAQVQSLVGLWQAVTGAIQVGRPRLTQRVIEVDYEPGGARISADAASQAVVAAGTAVNGCVGTAAPAGPTASASSLSPAADASAGTPEAEGE